MIKDKGPKTKAKTSVRSKVVQTNSSYSPSASVRPNHTTPRFLQLAPTAMNRLKLARNRPAEPDSRRGGRGAAQEGWQRGRCPL